MKKLFFLFAASALLAACSSDELGENGGVTPPAEIAGQQATSGSVEFANGTSIVIGDLDENADPVTRAAEDSSVEFCITLNDEVLKGFGAYKLLADDFAIRRDGEYVDINAKDNKVEKFNVTLEEQDLKIAVKGLEKLNFAKVDDYTFEVTLWVENKKLLNDGTGAFGELFTDADKAKWIRADEWPLEEGAETGTDISEAIFKNINGNAGFTATSQDAGLLVRYNVYRGLQGRNGDTPYIKVSVHVGKQDQTTEGVKPNESTWVHLDYTPKA